MSRYSDKCARRALALQRGAVSAVERIQFRPKPGEPTAAKREPLADWEAQNLLKHADRPAEKKYKSDKQILATLAMMAVKYKDALTDAERDALAETRRRITWFNFHVIELNRRIFDLRRVPQTAPSGGEKTNLQNGPRPGGADFHFGGAGALPRPLRSE